MICLSNDVTCSKIGIGALGYQAWKLKRASAIFSLFNSYQQLNFYDSGFLAFKPHCQKIK